MTYSRTSIMVGLCLVFQMICTYTIAQDEQLVPYCDVHLLDHFRPKGIEATYERLFDHGISSDSVADPRLAYSGDIRRNARWVFKARAPLYRVESFKSSITLEYHTENLALERPHSNDVSLVDNVGGRTLHKMSTTFYLIKPFRGKHFLLGRWKGSLNYEDIADHDLLGTAFRYSASIAYGTKHSSRVKYSFGFAYSYAFGRALFYPLFSYEKNYTSDWQLQLILPARVRLTKLINDKTHLMAEAALDGANYKVDIGSLGFDEPYVLERSDVRGLISFEREIYDWLWFKLSGGIIYNFNFSLVSDHGADRGELIVQNDVDPAPFFNTGLFIVPPRKMWNKRHDP